MRKWFEKAHGAIIWTVAIAFVAGIVIWSLTSYFASRRGKVKYSIEDSVAYLLKDDTVLDSKYWVFPWDLETSYNQILTQYQITDVDPVFEEPMFKASILNDLINTNIILYYAEINNISPTKQEVKAELDKQISTIKGNEQYLNYVNQKYGSLKNFESEIKPEIEKYLTIKKVEEAIADVSEEEMKQYYSKNKEELMNKYDKANVEYVLFTSQASANEFISEAMTNGFYQAATNMNLEIRSSENFKRGILTKEFEDSIFQATNNTLVGPLMIGNSYFIFNVKDVNTVDTYEKFSLSQGAQEVLEQLKSEKFKKAIEEFKSKENVHAEIVDDVLKTWNKVLKASGKDLMDVYKELNETVFEDATSVKVDVPVEIKAAFVTLVEKMNSATEVTSDPSYSKVLNDATEESKIVLESIYNDYPESFIALKKIKEIYSDRKDILYNYYTKLYSKIKPYIEYGMFQSVMNDFIDLYTGLNTLADATDISLDWKAEVLYDLYEINKMLKDATTASYYLEKLKEATPTYMDYEAAFNELEEMKNATTTVNSN